MKSGKSIGVLLILIGTLFLLNNLDLISVSFSEIIKTYWPIILIWLGVDRLLRKSKIDNEE